MCAMHAVSTSELFGTFVSHPVDVAATVACSIISSRLDYYTLCSPSPGCPLPISPSCHMSRTMNILARVLQCHSKHDHITPALFQLRWLPWLRDCSPNSDRHKVDVAWNNCFRKNFFACCKLLAGKCQTTIVLLQYYVCIVSRWSKENNFL